MLDTNSKKTKVMIFQKRAKKNSNLEFHIGKETIDIVHEYTYLGTRISSTGNFNISLKHLKEKSLHALFSLRKHTDFSKLKPSLLIAKYLKQWFPQYHYTIAKFGVYL